MAESRFAIFLSLLGILPMRWYNWCSAQCSSLTGKIGDQSEVGQGKRVVTELVQPYVGSGRVIVTGRFYTSIGLARTAT